MVVDVDRGHRNLYHWRGPALRVIQHQDRNLAIYRHAAWNLVADPGIFDIVAMFLDHTAWAWKLFMGIISIIAGGYILMYPVYAALVLPRVFVLVLGIWGLFQGIIMLIMAFRGGGWGAGVLGVLAIIFGLILIGNYQDLGMGAAFIWVTALFALVGGAFMVIRAFQARSA